MGKQFAGFLLRWLVNSLVLWLISLFFESVEVRAGLGAFIGSGFVLALANVFLLPAIILLSLPFYALSLGLLGAVVNVVVVFLADNLYSGFNFNGLWTTVLAGLTLGLVNYIINMGLNRLREE